MGEDKKLTYKAPYSGQIFEKITKDKTGRLFRVRFIIAETNGVVRGRIVSVEKVLEISGGGARRFGNLYLPCQSAIISPLLPFVSEFAFVSPFRDLNFLVSQMTRAPSLHS